MKPKQSYTIAVIGDGGWGTTLAVHLAKKNHTITLWSAFADYATKVQKNRYNSKFLPGIRLPQNVFVTSALAKTIKDAEIVVLATPSKYTPATLKKLKDFDFKGKILVSVTKGIDNETHKTMSQLIQQELKNVELAVLSGPTIASEVAAGIAATAVVAAQNPATARKVQDLFNSDTFRIYRNTDILGVEIGGSIKNVIAVACGVCDGLGYGTNTKAAIITRGLAEMARLGQIFGAKTKTFSGLSGLGDLVTTCMSPKSRNRTFGEQLGKGKTRTEILSKMEMVAEGVETVKAAYELSQKHKIDMPITEQVYLILYKNKKPAQAVKDLMSRETRAE